MSHETTPDTARAPEPPPVALRVRAIRLRLDAGTWGPGCAAEAQRQCKVENNG